MPLAFRRLFEIGNVPKVHGHGGNGSVFGMTGRIRCIDNSLPEARYLACAFEKDILALEASIQHRLYALRKKILSQHIRDGMSDDFSGRPADRLRVTRIDLEVDIVSVHQRHAFGTRAARRRRGRLRSGDRRRFGGWRWRACRSRGLLRGSGFSLAAARERDSETQRQGRSKRARRARQGGILEAGPRTANKAAANDRARPNLRPRQACTTTTVAYPPIPEDVTPCHPAGLAGSDQRKSHCASAGDRLRHPKLTFSPQRSCQVAACSA